MNGEEGSRHSHLDFADLVEEYQDAANEAVGGSERQLELARRVLELATEREGSF